MSEDHEEMPMQAWDDVTGSELGPKKVGAAREEEVGCIHRSRLCTKVPRAKAKGLKAKVTSVRWIGTNKRQPHQW